MRFGNLDYQAAYNEHVARGIRKSYTSRLFNNMVEGGKSFLLNYFPPVAGYLPVSLQNRLKENNKRKFGALRPEISTYTSAVIMGVAAYEIGLKLNGFDIGGVATVKEGWIEVERYVSYIGQIIPSLKEGIPKLYTQIASYAIISDAVPRIAANLFLNKPLGFLPFEGLDYVVSKLSERSKDKKEMQEMLERMEEQRKRVDTITGEGRLKIEREIEAIEAEILRDPSKKHLREQEADLLERLIA